MRRLPRRKRLQSQFAALAMDATVLPTRTPSPFPPLRLSVDEKQEILHTVDGLLNDAVAEYESFLLDDRCVVSDLQWKTSTKRDGFVAYRKRRVSPRANDSDKVHTVLVIGNMRGSIDDLLLGSVNPTGELAAAYMEYTYKESLVGSAILCPIELPTRERPDRFVAIQWDSHGSKSSTMNSIATPRDFVAVEVTGSTINSRGERLGYRFFHSVDVVGAPPFSDSEMIRSTKHFFHIYRQVSPDEIHIFVRGRVDPRGKVPLGLSARATGNGAIECVLRTQRFADIKKRTYLLHQQLVGANIISGESACFGIPEGYSVVHSAGGCSVCGKRASTMGILSFSKTCVLCSRNACGSCSDSKNVIVSNEVGRGVYVLTRKMAFCHHCLDATHQLNGADVAVAGVIAAARRTSLSRGSSALGSAKS